MLDKNYVKLKGTGEKIDLSDETYKGFEEGDFCEREINKPCKKHGVFCTVMTKLHLKKKKKLDKEKLFNEDINQNDEKFDPSTRHDLPCETHGRKRNINDWFQSKSINVTSPNTKLRSKSKLNHEKECLISDDLNEDFTAEETLIYKGKKVDFRVLPEKYELLQEITIIDNEYDNSSEVDCDEINEKNVMNDLHSNQKQSTKQYLKKQWKGKRAKKARKRIRRFVGRSWVYLKAGISGSNSPVLDITTATTALISSMSREDH